MIQKNIKNIPYSNQDGIQNKITKGIFIIKYASIFIRNIATITIYLIQFSSSICFLLLGLIVPTKADNLL